MKIFLPSQVKRMRQVQDAHMPDGCRIHSFVKMIQDEDGQPIPHYEIGDVQKCGFTLNFSMERFVDSGEGQKFFYEVRLPSNVALKKTDLVQMMHRGGVPVQDQTIFQVSGTPRFGITATVVGLKENVP